MIACPECLRELPEIQQEVDRLHAEIARLKSEGRDCRRVLSGVLIQTGPVLVPRYVHLDDRIALYSYHDVVQNGTVFSASKE